MKPAIIIATGGFRMGIYGSLQVLLLFFAASVYGQSSHFITPLEKMPSQGIQIVSGDPGEPGSPFVLRIHNDEGFIVPPHTHPTDENIVVVKGTWSVGMGARINEDELQRMDTGDYVFVPEGHAHFGQAITEVIVQIHGVGPFSVDFVDPLYELSENGISVMTTWGVPEAVQEAPSGCFTLQIGDHVSGTLGEGIVVGALCTPELAFTQYWVEYDNSKRFWATASELTKQ